MRLRTLVVAAIFILLGATAHAQTQIPPPAGPVTVCFSQAAPAADSHQLVFDGGAPEAISPTTPAAAVCGGGASHSFIVPASRFTVGTHTIVIRSVNAFGTTVGPVYTVLVGIAPGSATVTAVIAGD